jgi:3-oxoacyl-[acyl-carrier protein] reductase
VAEETARLMDSFPIVYEPAKADVSDPMAIADLFAGILGRFGKIDVVIANAGIEIVDKPFTDYSEADFDKIYSLNVKGTFFGMQHAAKYVVDGGRIILISSTQSLNAETGAAIYASSKSAGKKFVDILSKELGQDALLLTQLCQGS